MDDLVGRQLGRYTVIEKIGQGGMAEVYRGLQPSANRQVAIKVLPRQFTHDPNFLERFRAEGRLIASLEHPNIVPVYDLDEADGLPYIVMRLIEGGSLAQRLEKGPMPEGEVLHLGWQVANALDYAHSRNVIHRDVKPGNVLLDREGNAHVADFGLAKIIEATAALTRTGLVLGTPEFMSPEQGEGGTLTHRSDLYSFAAMLYTMLTDQPVFSAPTPMGVLYRHLHEPVPSAREKNPSLPDAADPVFQVGLAKKPGDRFSSGKELVATLASAVGMADRSMERWARRVQAIPGASTHPAEPASQLPTLTGQTPLPQVPEAAPLTAGLESAYPPTVREASSGYPLQPVAGGPRPWRYAVAGVVGATLLAVFAALGWMAAGGSLWRATASATPTSELVVPLTGATAVQGTIPPPAAVPPQAGANPPQGPVPPPVPVSNQASIGKVTGTVTIQLPTGVTQPVTEGQPITPQPGQVIETGQQPRDFARLDLPGGIVVFFSPGSEIELRSFEGGVLTLVLLRGQMLFRFPLVAVAVPIVEIISPSGVNARVTGLLVGVQSEASRNGLYFDCLEGTCYLEAGGAAESIPAGSNAIVDDGSGVNRGQGTKPPETWAVPSELVPTATPTATASPSLTADADATGTIEATAATTIAGPTATGGPVSTATSTPTVTGTEPPLASGTPTPTDTPSPTDTALASPSPTDTPIAPPPGGTDTPTPTDTPAAPPPGGTETSPTPEPTPSDTPVPPPPELPSDTPPP